MFHCFSVSWFWHISLLWFSWFSYNVWPLPLQYDNLLMFSIFCSKLSLVINEQFCLNNVKHIISIELLHTVVCFITPIFPSKRLTFLKFSLFLSPFPVFLWTALWQKYQNLVHIFWGWGALWSMIHVIKKVLAQIISCQFFVVAVAAKPGHLAP